MTETNRRLLVVIPTHGRPALLERTLDSLAHANLPACYAGTLVVENGGREPAVAATVSRASPGLHVTHSTFEAKNKSAALNAVLARTDNELLVFLDDDVRVSPGTLEAYAAAAARRETAKVYFGGPLDIDYEEAPPEWLRAFLPPSAAGWAWDGASEYVDVPDFLGGNWAACADDLRTAGGFDVARGPGARSGATGQEREMQRGLLATCYRGCYVPGARVWHFVPRERCTPKWVLRRAFRNGVSAGLTEPVDPGPRLAGVPRWMVRMALAKAAALGRAQWRRSDAARFSALFDLYAFLGRMQGCRLAAHPSQEPG